MVCKSSVYISLLEKQTKVLASTQNQVKASSQVHNSWDNVSICFSLLIFAEVACDHAEGGMYIGPEFQLGQVYDGSVENGDTIVLYRPVYLSVVSQGLYCFVFAIPLISSVFF